MSACGSKLDGEIEGKRKGKRPAWGFYYCAPLSTEWLRHVTEPLSCGGSGSLARLQPPDSLSPGLHWLPAHQLTFNYLLSQTHSEEVPKHSTKSLWRFCPLTHSPLQTGRKAAFMTSCSVLSTGLLDSFASHFILMSSQLSSVEWTCSSQRRTLE